MIGIAEVVLDASQLVRYVMLRAHENGHMAPAPAAIKLPPNMEDRDFSGKMRSAQAAMRMADDVLRRAQEYKRWGKHG